MVRTNILPVGSKFIVRETIKNNSVLPGTCGFFSFVNSQISYAVSEICVVIIRRGKGGKDRVDITYPCVPVVYINNEDFIREYVRPKDINYVVDLEKVDLEYNNILDVSPIEFIGWAMSFSLLLDRLSTRYNFKSLWPTRKSYVLNYLLSLDYNNNPTKVNYKYSDEEYRRRVVNEIRRMSSILTRPYISSTNVVYGKLCQSIERIVSTNKYLPADGWKRFRVNIYNKYDIINTLFNANKNNNKIYKANFSSNLLQW